MTTPVPHAARDAARATDDGSAIGLERLAERAVAGDRAARAALVSASLPLLRRIARTYRGRGVEQEDLEHDAVVGLLRALERFDPQRGTPFWAYARWWVRQALQQAVAEGSRAVRLPTHVLWDMHEVKETRERLTRERGAEPGAMQIADALGWSPARVREALRAEQPSSSLDEQRETGQSAAELLEDPLAADRYERVLLDLSAEQLRPALLRLSEREREVLALRSTGDSLRTIGRRLGVSGQRVQAIEGRALAKVRAAASVGVDTQPRTLTRRSAGGPPATRTTRSEEER